MTDTFSPRARSIVASLVVLAFIAGGAAGFAMANALAPAPIVRTHILVPALLDELQLTPEQREQADAIMARSAPLSREAMRLATERLAAVADSVDTELRAILSPEQRARLDAMRSDKRMLIKRKVATPEGTRVDTVLDTTLPRR
jgi:hypothetical protein